jgi:lysyl-tRNA synthetase class I
MALRQVIKYKRKNISERLANAKRNNKQEKQEEAMDEKINRAEEIMNNMKAANHVKVVKKDKGLIERTESSKIVLTEDNRQVLND